jgi:hypothetical protein
MEIWEAAMKAPEIECLALGGLAVEQSYFRLIESGELNDELEDCSEMLITSLLAFVE